METVRAYGHAGRGACLSPAGNRRAMVWEPWPEALGDGIFRWAYALLARGV